MERILRNAKKHPYPRPVCLRRPSDYDNMQPLMSQQVGQGVNNWNTSAPALSFRMREPREILLASIAELGPDYYSSENFDIGKICPLIAERLRARGYHFSMKQILHYTLSLRRPDRNKITLAQSKTGNRIKEENTKNSFERTKTEKDDMGSLELGSDISAICGQQAEKTNADILHELREIKTESMLFHQNILKFLQERAQRSDQRAKREEQFAMYKYKVIEQLLKQRGN